MGRTFKFLPRATAILLALALCVALLPVYARAEESHNHGVENAWETVDFEPLPDGTASITESGSFYLTANSETTGITVSGEGVVVNLCLDGHQLVGTQDKKPVIAVSGGATLNLCDCYDASIDTGEEYSHTYQDRFGLNYHAVSGGLISTNVRYGTVVGVQVSDGSSFNFYGGTIGGCGGTDSNLYATGNGGGIVLKKGSVTIHDGATIEHCVAKNGAGVYVNTGSKSAENYLKMSGGTIKNCIAATSSQNEKDTAKGGGIYLGKYSTFEFSGGKITANTATSGAGVYVSGHTETEMTGGEITDGTASSDGGGVVLSSSSSNLRISGDIVIDGNTSGTGGQESNLCLDPTSNTVVLTGPLSDNAKIGVTYLNGTETDDSFVTVADNYGSDNADPTDVGKFYSDDGGKSVVMDDDGKVAVRAGRIHAVCGKTCDHEEKHEQVTFEAVDTDFTGGTLSDGSYFLDRNVELTEPITITGTVNFCLNGHEIKNETGRVFTVASGATLNVTDCYAGAAGDEYVHTYVHPRTRVDTTINGGLISGRATVTTPCGGIEVSGGVLNLYGGTIAGASVKGGVRVTDGGTFNLYDGAVNDCWNSDSGGGVYVDSASVFNMYGGEIENNYAGRMGGGVYAVKGFNLSGSVSITDNIVRNAANNVYLPLGQMIHVTGPVSGTVGVTMAQDGVFTTGGAAPYVKSFKADELVGTYADVDGEEVAITGYGIDKQPTPANATVIMKCPDNVADYQWYQVDTQAQPAWSETLSEAATDVAYGDFTLSEGDTIQITADITAAYLMQTTTVNGEDFLEQAAIGQKIDGSYYVLAPSSGDYALWLSGTWSAGSSVTAQVTLFRRGDAIAIQTGASYTGQNGTYICKAVYSDGVTSFYTIPVAVSMRHSHASCGTKCTHETTHAATTYTPAANGKNNTLLLGETVGSTLLPSGSYYLMSDVTLNEGLTVPSGETVNLCLNGHSLTSLKGSALNVETDAVLTLCDCAGGGSITGSDAENGGGIYLAGTAKLYDITITGGHVTGQGGGVYVADTGRLEISGDVKITGNTNNEGDSNVYLPKGAVVFITGELSDDALIGISMEDLDIFTDGASADMVDLFTSDMAGKNVSADESGELTIATYKIISQPTASRPTFEITKPERAEFQWYALTDTEVTSENVLATGKSVYDEDAKKWLLTSDETGFTLSLEEGQFLRLVLSGSLADNAALQVERVVYGLGGNEIIPIEAGADGAYVLHVETTGAYTVRLVSVAQEEPEDGSETETDATDSAQEQAKKATCSLTATVYVIGEAVEEQTSATFTGSNGAYLCRATYQDGTVLQSDPVLVNRSTTSSGSTLKPQSDEYDKWYEDVAETAWYYEDVKAVTKAGIMIGTSENRFSPKGMATRAMAVTTLWRLAGEPEPEGTEAPFSDIVPGSYYEKAAIWAAENNIVNGVGGGKFEPRAAVTREQAAVMLYRYAKYVAGNQWTEPEDAQTALVKFPDQPGHWAQDAVGWAVSTGILRGRTDGTLAPKDGTARSELAAMLNRYMSIQ